MPRRRRPSPATDARKEELLPGSHDGGWENDPIATGRHRSRIVRGGLVASLVIGLATLAACADDGEGRTILVPDDHATVQEAVDAARSGDTVIIGTGTWREAVKVTRDGITIRGRDRNATVLDGGHRLANGFYVGADGVTVENLTVRNYTQNGIVFNGIDAATEGKGPDPAVEYGTPGNALVGYATRFVTAHNNGLYGIYAFAASDGVIEDSFVSAHPDSGIYIGQCNPCRAVVRRVVARLNAIGYYGTNASGDVWIVESTFADNRLGIAPNSQEMEKLAPQEGATVAGNLVLDNDDPTAPAIPEGFFGGGIAVGGGLSNVVVRNRVEGHGYAGIVVNAMNGFLPEGNRIEGNVLADNAVDLLWSPAGARGADGNCFAGNTFVVSRPADIERRMPCTGSADVTARDVVPGPTMTAPVRVDHRMIPAPGPQETMPGPRITAPPTPIVFVAPDLGAVTVPDR